ncbi:MULTISPECIES: regulatory protein RecX [Microbacterium]|uniref:regulatory protein RecX n=1 Tax=Microbacterium TaxID=33882 RepID=UPI00217D2109|nr:MULTISPECIES: regulatory protein RecX [Microbacterium]UWF78360.1 regulatory protein RecX [Microbacterium neungamense]WCM56537.1 regulatory protein RecX [Microbacterium sp. EF45047]
MADRGEGHGDAERLAPVIPIFGRRAAASDTGARSRGSGGGAADAENSADVDGAANRADVGGTANRTAADGAASGGGAPVSSRHPAFSGGATQAARPRLRALRPHEDPATLEPAATAAAAGDADHTDEEVRWHAEEVLVRRLRARALSVAEARAILADTGLDDRRIDEIIDEFTARRYLDDRTLAGHLVTSGSERKGQGRLALARTLSQRGIPREIIDEALAALPDDEAERALEFARTKARGMTGLEPDTALRRLLGQLARRGYAGSVAMTAARTALRETGGPQGGVRFVESD